MSPAVRVHQTQPKGIYMRVATVVLDIATQALDQGYSYQVPDSFPDDLIGRAVHCSVWQ